MFCYRTSESSEEVSVYDIKDHPDYRFRPGDIVVAVGDPNVRYGSKYTTLIKTWEYDSFCRDYGCLNSL